MTTVVARICINILRDRRPGTAELADAFMPEPIISTDEAGDPEYQALLADAVGIALQVVISALSPPERLAYVLHDMFAVPFDEVGALLDRSPDAARQLASRARRRVQGSAPCPEPDVAHQQAVVDAYFAASW